MSEKQYIEREALEKRIHTGMNIIEAMQAIIDTPAEIMAGMWYDGVEKPAKSGWYWALDDNEVFDAFYATETSSVFPAIGWWERNHLDGSMSKMSAPDYWMKPVLPRPQKG